MKKILFIIFLILLILPQISARVYGEGVYGSGVYEGSVTDSSVNTGGGSGGGGGGSSSNLQFDIKILEFESQINLGDDFDFMYFIKGVGSINHDVIIDFWIEKDGEIMTSGSDVIFMGINEEKTEPGSLFLPNDTDSGTYKFVIKVSYGNIKAEAHRTIELTIKEGEAIIGSLIDIRFSLEEILMQNSGEISADIIFENFGNISIPVNLTWIILDSFGNEIYTERENIDVETEMTLEKYFENLALPEGRYTFILQTLHSGDIHDEFKQDFEIRKESELLSYLKNIWIWYSIGFIFLALLIWIVILLTKLRERKKCKKTVRKVKYFDKETGKPRKGKKIQKKKKNKRKLSTSKKTISKKKN